MRQPTKPSKPSVPRLPERRVFIKDSQNLYPGQTLASIVAGLPMGLLLDDITFRNSHGRYDDYTQASFEWNAEIDNLDYDSHMKDYEKAFKAYQIKLATWTGKMAQYEAEMTVWKAEQDALSRKANLAELERLSKWAKKEGLTIDGKDT